MAGNSTNIFLILALGLILRSVVELQAFVQTDPEVIGWKDDQETRLKCETSKDAYAVYWDKINETDPVKSLRLAQIFNEDKTSNVERFSIEDDFTLVIEDVRVADEGRYSCQVVTSNTDDSTNFTNLIVYALASRPSVEQCDYEETYTRSSGPLRCSLPTTSAESQFNLECKVTGFRPNISLEWKSSERTVTLSGPPSQRELEDGTWERVITIGVIGKESEDQNYTCVASGAAMNGTQYAYVTIQAKNEPSQQQSSAGRSAGIAVACIVVILVIFGLLILVGVVMRDHGMLSDTGVAALNIIPCLRKPYSKPGADQECPVEEVEVDDRPSPEEIRLNELNEKREKLRESIRNYKPKHATGGTASDFARVNIGMFGQMGAGKSTFINTLNFALNGKYKVLSEEGNIESSGGKTLKRAHYSITDSIDLIDSRGMQSFADTFLRDIEEQTQGKRGIDPEKAISPKKEEEIHCGVFVYHYKEFGKDQALGFINKLFTKLFKYYGRSPMFVVTHKDELELSSKDDAQLDIDLSTVKGMLKSLSIPEENIWFFENYTPQSNIEDLEKDIALLDFLEQALFMCDQNIKTIEAEKKEKHENRGLLTKLFYG